MSNQTKTSQGTIVVFLVIGLAMMVGGFALSENWHPEALTKLAEQGIPLDLGKTVSAIGVFLILFKLIESFYFVPLRESINDRTTSLEDTFSEAESLRTEMTTMRNEYEARLVQTEAAAREKIQAQIKEAQEQRGQLIADATQKADQFMRKAQEEIESEKQRALSDIRGHVVNLSLMATEHLLGENIDDARNRKLVQDFIDKVEVPA